MIASIGLAGGADARATLRGAAGSLGFSGAAVTGASPASPTSLAWGPDRRLYVAQWDGRILAYSVERVGSGEYRATATEVVDLVRDLPNHQDDGTPNPAVTGRQVTGLLATGTPAQPVLYVSSSDPRMGDPGSGTDPGLDTNSGVLTRLTRTGTSWQKLDLVRGLPRSEDNHATNGLALDPVSNTLYVAQGGHTNMGAPSINFAYLPEYALSAAILSVDLDAIGGQTYDLPTLDDETRSNSGPGGADTHDPFGGNDGRNQARLVPGGPVQVHASGLRNPYDLVRTASGRLFVIDNGPNAGGGGPPTDCTNATREPGVTYRDNLHVAAAGSYLGHPNPTRGNRNNTFNSSNPQSPVAVSHPAECAYRVPGTADGAWTTFPASTNGVAEYTGNNFGGALAGDLLAVSFDGTVWRMKPDAAGTGLADLDPPNGTIQQAIFSGFGAMPLDVAVIGPAGPFPGTVWIAVFGAGTIVAFEPDDYSGGGPGCAGADDAGLDEDGDGYSNADEIDNRTDPCSAASLPPDWDGDAVSNANDPDDDNDGLPDTTDRFAIDAANGTATLPPVFLEWNPGDPPTGLVDLGFTGLMSDGVTDYASRFDPANMTAGGAPGIATVDLVPEGDARGPSNSQHYGFQFGVNLGHDGVRCVARTRLVGPFAGIPPQDFQSFGLFIGTGTQDDFLRVVACANGGAGGVEVGLEVGGVHESTVYGPGDGISILGTTHVDLAIMIDPATRTAEPEVQIGSGPAVRLPVVVVPAAWTTGVLAVGIIATSRGPGPAFAATWDRIELVTVPPADTGNGGRAPLAMEAASPNPFASGTAFSFTLPSAARAALEVFDLQGARVRRVLEEFLPGGRHRVSWDGRNDDGERVPPGLYHARLQSGPGAVTRRVVCAR